MKTSDRKRQIENRLQAHQGVMKQNHEYSQNLAVLVISIFTVLLVATSAAEEFREFTNTSGSKLQGEVISASGSEVTLELADGRKVSGGVNFFSKADQEYISNWIEENPIQIDYDFATTLSRNREDKRESNEGSIVSIYEDWQYKITLENRSKNGTTGADVAGLVTCFQKVRHA